MTDDRLYGDSALALVSLLKFAKLTMPVLDQMRRGAVFRSLADIALRRGETGILDTGGEWGPSVPGGGCRLRINRSGQIRTEILLRRNGALGPDQIAGRTFDVCGDALPLSVLTACVGMRIGEIVEPARVNDVVTGDERIRKAESRAWGTRFELDLSWLQPTDHDLREMRRSDREQS